MTLKNFAVVTGDIGRTESSFEYWDGVDRCIAIFQRTALDGAFDHILQLRPPNRRLHPHEWNILAEKNLPAFNRIISRKHERETASTGKPVSRIEVNLSDLQNSDESFIRDSLPIKTGKEWSREDWDCLAYELRRTTPLLEIAEYLKRDVVEVETMADRIELP